MLKNIFFRPVAYCPNTGMHRPICVTCVLLPGHAQTGESSWDDENIEAGERVNPQSGVSSGQASRQQIEDHLQQVNSESFRVNTGFDVFGAQYNHSLVYGNAYIFVLPP